MRTLAFPQVGGRGTEKEKWTQGKGEGVEGKGVVSRRAQAVKEIQRQAEQRPREEAA